MGRSHSLDSLSEVRDLDGVVVSMNVFESLGVHPPIRRGLLNTCMTENGLWFLESMHIKYTAKGLWG